jgi:hypothetical protein
VVEARARRNPPPSRVARLVDSLGGRTCLMIVYLFAGEPALGHVIKGFPSKEGKGST